MAMVQQYPAVLRTTTTCVRHVVGTVALALLMLIYYAVLLLAVAVMIPWGIIQSLISRNDAEEDEAQGEAVNELDPSVYRDDRRPD